ncbi:MAG: prepilin-type N-terminal cleavage/methylation domain-containing protein [Candidatus Levyibacteriota bacterium]
MRKFIKKFFTRYSLFLTQKGQSLIEAIAAMAIIAIVVTAIAVAITTSLSNTKYNQNMTLTTKYAQQGSEIVRQIRNNDYNGFKNISGTYCLAKSQTTLGAAQSDCTSPNADSFIRSVQIEQSPGCATNVAKVTVVVAFADSKCLDNTFCHSVTNTSCLSTINPIQSP